MQAPAPAAGDCPPIISRRSAAGARAGGAGRGRRSRCSSASLTRRLLLAIEGERFHTQPIAHATVKAVRRVTFVLSLLVLVFPALDFAGVELTVGLHPEDVAQWADAKRRARSCC